MHQAKILLVIPPDEHNYLSGLRNAFGTATLVKATSIPSTLFELDALCKKHAITGVVSSSLQLLQLVMKRQYGRTDKVSLDNYAGSIFTLDSGAELVFVNPLKQLYAVPYGKHIATRYISKVARKDSWRETSPFVFDVIDSAQKFKKLQSACMEAIAIAVDIETSKDPLRITCCGFTAIAPDLSTYTGTIPIESMNELHWIRTLLWDTQAPKCFQNGKYDISYLLRFQAPVYNYTLDTINLFHSWLCELPKDLAFISAYTVRNSMYWKDLAKSPDKFEQLLYNGKDCWNTAESLITLLLEMPDWATANYTNLEFPTVHPAILCEATGIKSDTEKLAQVATEQKMQASALESALERMTWKGFNPASPKQTATLLQVLGFKEDSADAATLTKCSFGNPLASRILGAVIKYRKITKLIGTYLDPDKLFNGRVLYAINPHGTDTGRQASKEHHFWCGLNIQNQPRGKTVKQTMRADPGYFIAENDLAQAESRGTAHIAGCEAMIEAVTGSRDFHSVNCSAFFGVPYEKIYCDELHATVDKVLRDLAKRVNHGANYNMGAGVLLQTMGLAKVYEARKLLGLKSSMSPTAVCEFLLSRFHATYPELREVYYAGVKQEIASTGLLRSKAILDGKYPGFVRKCFDDPLRSKRAENAYVAHPPQSLNAQNLNIAFKKVFWEIWYPQREERNFKLCAQIHDSILYQVRMGHEYLCERVAQLMSVPIQIEGYDGKFREFSVPADVKAGKDFNSIYWSETE
jgi:DNA polymerase I-like protein with 3'-5' exonuclease and polymerase domains